jgi:hypothetical protein
MDKIEILNIEINSLDKPLTGSNMKRNGFEIQDVEKLKQSGIKEDKINFWIFRPELTLNKQILVRIVDEIKMNLQIKFFQQKVLELTKESAPILIDQKYSKEFFLSITVGETLVLMGKDLQPSLLEGFEDFFKNYKTKCQTLKLSNNNNKENVKEKGKLPVSKLKKATSQTKLEYKIPENLEGIFLIF